MSEGKPQFVQQIYINAPVARVWEAITQRAIVNQYYLCPLVQETLATGGPITYGSEEQPMISGEVLEAVENERLVHTFSFAHQPDDPSTRVTYELTAHGEELTGLLLRHEFDTETATYHDVSGGWPSILSSLKSLLETGKPLSWPQPAEA